MALCDPCYDVILMFEGGRILDDTSAVAFRDWLASQDDKDSTPKTLPQLPGLLYSSWESFCASLDSYCPVCWVVWRRIRKSPTASYRDENRPGFNVWVDRGVSKDGNTGCLMLKRSIGTKDSESITLGFERTNKQRFEENVARCPIEEHMGSETTAKTVKRWLSACDVGGGCVEKRGSIMNSTAIPTRLIDVHSCGSQTWSLVETNQHKDFSKYVALSHRWTVDTPRLLRANYLAMQTGRPDSAVPRNYQDVFVLCRNLDIRYVWIDSLCILQDSADDFLHEAASMTEVYANAYCTFSICWESPDGFLRPREIHKSCRYDYLNSDSPDSPDRYTFVHDFREWYVAIGNSPVYQRGWVLQEQLLSPRILYLGNDEFYWECDHIQLCETEPEFLSPAGSDYRRGQIVFMKEERRRAWQDLVVQYMSLNLSFERDRLLAISGIARLVFSPGDESIPERGDPDSCQRVEQKLGQTVDYFAGLQRAYWIEDLLWCPNLGGSTYSCLESTENRKPGPESFKRCLDDIVPSWSWAACPGPIRWTSDHAHYGVESLRLIGEMPRPNGGPLVCLRKCNFEPLGNDVYGLPKSASLDISCLLIQAEYTELTSSQDGPKCSQGYENDQVMNEYPKFYTDGFLLPLPYPRRHTDERSVVTVPVEPCDGFTPTCFIMPLHEIRHSNFVKIMGLVVQERPLTDSKTREFVRIGSFAKYHIIEEETEQHQDLGCMGIVNAFLKHVPTDGDEFEQKLRECAQEWKEEENIGDEARDGAMVKAEWTTIRLV